MLTFLTAATPGYIHYAKALVSSAAVNYPLAKFAVELINVDKSEEKDFQRRNAKCQVFFNSVKHKREREFGSNRKGPLLQHVRENGSKDVLLWVDADSIVRKSLDPVMGELSKDMVMRPKATRKKVIDREVNECYSGVFSFSNSARGISLLKTYATIGRDNLCFGTDQDYLGYVYFTNQDANLGILPDTLLDFKMKSDSIIWTLKCTPKTINARFHREHRTYLEM